MRKNRVLCRFSPGLLFLPAKVRRLTEETVEVKHPVSGDLISFTRTMKRYCDGQSVESADLDIIMDAIPSGKLINIGCPVLTPCCQTQTSMCNVGDELDVSENVKKEHSNGAFVLCRIIEKEYKPLRAKVMYSDGLTAWFSREEMRVMLSPWVGWETLTVTRCDKDTDSSDGRPCSDHPHQKKKRSLRRRGMIPPKKYKKGDVVRLPHGILKKVKTSGKRDC